MTAGASLRLALLLVALFAGRAVAADVAIGLAVPLSGPDSVFGDQIRLGVAQAITDANRAGGFLGQPGRLVTRDDGADPKKAVDAATSIVAERVPFVIGDVSSAATVASSTIYADAKTLQITPSALAPLVTDREIATLFRVCGRDDQQADAAARALVARHVARVAIVHERTTAGKDFADGVRKSIGPAGLREVFYGTLETGSRDLSALVGRIKGSGAQALVFGGSPAEAGLLARQLRDANVRMALLGSAALASDEFANAAGPAADGTMMIFPGDVKAHASAANLLRRFRDNRIEPDAYVFYSYAAVQVLQQAAAAANSLDPSEVAATMHSGREFTTVIGPLAFDAKGDPKTSDFSVYVWHKGATGRMTFDEQAKS